MTRFAPAESPIKIIFEGSFLRVAMRWLRIMAACCSCLGYLAVGRRSGWLLALRQ